MYYAYWYICSAQLRNSHSPRVVLHIFLILLLHTNLKIAQSLDRAVHMLQLACDWQNRECVRAICTRVGDTLAAQDCEYQKSQKAFPSVWDRMTSKPNRQAIYRKQFDIKLFLQWVSRLSTVIAQSWDCTISLLNLGLTRTLKIAAHH